MEFITHIAEGFISMFQEGGAIFTSWVGGIIPMVVCLMTFVNAIVKLIGEERVEKVARRATGNVLGRYLLLPFLANMFLANPMCYTFGRFVEEKYKPAYYDSTVSFVHPITSLFPHANAGELFVYMGIATGITQLGLSLGVLAIRYFLVGLIIIFIRGIVTEWIYLRMLARAEEN